MRESVADSFFYSLVRLIDSIYQDEDLEDILYFILSLAVELTGGKGSAIRVLEHESFDLKAVSSYGLSKEFVESGPIDFSKSVTEIMEGDIIICNDFENDSRVQNLDAARKEGVSSVIGLPFTVNEYTYSIMRVYYSQKKVPTHEEIELLNSLGKISCLAIERAVLRGLSNEASNKRDIA